MAPYALTLLPECRQAPSGHSAFTPPPTDTVMPSASLAPLEVEQGREPNGVALLDTNVDAVRTDMTVPRELPENHQSKGSVLVLSSVQRKHEVHVEAR